MDAKNKYSELRKMVSTLWSCFHGLVVESSFNVMGDIIDVESTNTSVLTSVN